MRDGGEGRGGEGKRYSKYGSTLPLFSLPLRLSFASHPRLCANGSKRSLLSHNELKEEPKKDPAPFVFLLHSSSFFTSEIRQSYHSLVCRRCIVCLSCVQFTKASPPAITLNYPPVTAELMFGRHHSDSRTEQLLLRPTVASPRFHNQGQNGR